ncbi:hypothetical protein IMSAGC020_01438 [Lachnospiraceae bacterium]|nr:hypothetical protein IMSAGC020_01438 [Lachnospiraceae bacterium]
MVYLGVTGMAPCWMSCACEYGMIFTWRYRHEGEKFTWLCACQQSGTE